MLTACESVPQRKVYNWAPYDKSVKAVAAWSDSFDVAEQIRVLNKHVADTEKHELILPPGFRVHLAYLYLLDGDQSAAQQLLETEKSVFPESQHFVDSLRARLKQAGSRSDSQ